jgi:hypothetical protein
MKNYFVLRFKNKPIDFSGNFIYDKNLNLWINIIPIDKKYKYQESGKEWKYQIHNTRYGSINQSLI